MIIYYILIILIQFLNCQICSIDNPTHIDNCTVAVNTTNYCCYSSLFYQNETNTLCVLIPKNIGYIASYIKDMTLPGAESIDVNIDCGIKDTKNNTCGNPNPKNIDDCKNFSIEGRSCCLFKSVKSSMCFLNDNNQAYNQKVFGYDLICNEFHIKLSIIILVILIFL